MRIFFFPIGTTVQREFDIVQQVCSKKLKSCDGYKENIKKRPCCIDGGSLSLTRRLV